MEMLPSTLCSILPSSGQSVASLLPTMKLLPLTERAIADGSKAGVLVPICSRARDGPLVACERTGRRVVAAQQH